RQTPLYAAQTTVATATPARKPARRAIQGCALRKVQSQNLHPEALPARRANISTRRARDRNNPKFSVSSFQGNHNTHFFICKARTRDLA
ncbi:hypothetical protein A2U01_0080744, partial [Trifolium medium]|nr:hypothetical protein [Trifolium medium]